MDPGIGGNRISADNCYLNHEHFDHHDAITKTEKRRAYLRDLKHKWKTESALTLARL
jgi:hypothetical protein